MTWVLRAGIKIDRAASLDQIFGSDLRHPKQRKEYLEPHALGFPLGIPHLAEEEGVGRA